MTMLTTLGGLAAEILLIAVWLRALSSTVLGAFFVLKKPLPSWWSSVQVKDGDTLLSAVVPAYNESAIIQQTVDQLIRAVRPANRIVVVDDGSTDGTADIASLLLDHGNMQVIRLSKNGGKAAALNAGLKGVRSKFVLTIDADTTVDQVSIAKALHTMEQADADAVSFWIDVDPAQSSVFARLQSLEYSTTMNFERAAQSVIGLISVMPGAATLYRATSLPAGPFSSRTSTEDADLTLRLSREGKQLFLCPSSRAVTLAPTTLRGLVLQRRRWTLGHLQCCILHALEDGGVRRFKYFTLSNFALATLSPIIMLCSFLLIVSVGQTPVLKLSLMSAFVGSTIIVYLQRLTAFVLFGMPMKDVVYAIVEPVFSGFIQAASFLLALAKLRSFHWADGPYWGRPAWRK